MQSSISREAGLTKTPEAAVPSAPPRANDRKLNQRILPHIIRGRSFGNRLSRNRWPSRTCIHFARCPTHDAFKVTAGTVFYSTGRHPFAGLNPPRSHPKRSIGGG